MINNRDIGDKMENFSQIVQEVSSNFLNEAKQSPQLISDMAKMEYYMAESYSGRLFIELLQNADDARSTRIISYYNNGNLYFANNGKPFDKNDLIAISRSGASGKERGKTIGYRGIGFKSASAITNDIIIHSANTYFSFSKGKCAELLSMSEDNVPTIRIPLYVDNIEDDVRNDVEQLKANGYSTIFIFRNADINSYLSELSDVDSGYFIFLNNIYECSFEIGKDFIKNVQINRFTDCGNQHIEIVNDNDSTEWMLVKERNVSVAYLIENGIIVPCDEKQAVYHCYLPTLEKSFMPCKINADFSTDPSRKHITIDDRTKAALEKAANVIGTTFELAINEAESGKYKNIFNLYLNKSIISKLNYFLADLVEEKVANKKWIKLNDGTYVSPKEYKLLPTTFDIEKPELVRTAPGKVADNSASKDVYENIDNVDEFMGQFSQEQISPTEIASDLSNESYVAELNKETHIQLLTSVIRETKIQETLEADNPLDLGTVLVVNSENELTTIDDLVENNQSLDTAIKGELEDRLSESEKAWIDKKIGDDDFVQAQEQPVSPLVAKIKGDDVSFTTHIAKWRDAENKCVLIEESFGNKATDVSMKNYGYDVESITPDGTYRYIEVKSVKKDFSFSLTNNEYTAAHEYGDKYYICLLFENENQLEVRYIQNPLENAKFEKRIKQWEWICLESTSTLITFDYDE